MRTVRKVMRDGMYHGHLAIEHLYRDGRCLRVYRPIGPQGPIDTPITERALLILLVKEQSGNVSPEEAGEIVRIANLGRLP